MEDFAVPRLEDDLDFDDEDLDVVELSELDRLAWTLLQTGNVGAFNLFRQRNPGYKPNLDGFYAPEVYSFDGIDLSGASLRDAIFQGKRLVGANFAGARLMRANFDGAVLTRASFAGAMMEGARLCGATCGHTLFTGCELNEAAFCLAINNGSDFTGASLQRVNFNGSRGFEQIDLVSWFHK